MEKSPNYEGQKKNQGDFSPFIKKKPVKSTENRYEKADKPVQKKHVVIKKNVQKAPEEGIRLNKFIANSGVCSRRNADKLIENGEIKVNGVIINTLGSKVMPGDKVTYKDRVLVNERLQYILMNKPKGVVTTVDDPQGRRTVMQLVEKACQERVYPVGRLDLNTTGVLLLSNDGEMAKKLTHPSHNIQKVYHVILDKPLSKNDMDSMLSGIELEDGMTKVDEIFYVNVSDKKEIGVEIHSGKNRIIRRLFETLEYQVEKLDRVMFAGLTKKDLPRGHWRFLNDKEISFLKMLR